MRIALPLLTVANIVIAAEIATSTLPALPVNNVGIAGLSPELSLAVIGGFFALLMTIPPIITVIVQAAITAKAKLASDKRLDDVAKTLSETTTATTSTLADHSVVLKQIHGLANSAYTASIQSILDGAKRELIAHKLNMVLLASSPPSAAVDEARALTKDSIAVCEATIIARINELADRKRQQDVIDKLTAAKNDVQKVTIVEQDDNPVPVIPVVKP